MVHFAQYTGEELRIATAIANRALRAGIYTDALMADMDLSAVHAQTPLRLADLLAADAFNFAHDMRGIRQHLNRKTGTLERQFLPRFAKGEAPAEGEGNGTKTDELYQD